MEQIRWFEEAGIGAIVLLPGKKWADSPLEISERGILTIPPGLQPTGFHLLLYAPCEAHIVITQKNVGLEKGGYYHHTLGQIEDGDFTIYPMIDPIIVARAGERVWTVWHDEKNPTRTNRLDCFSVERDGRLGLFQVGVITHDDGQTFRLLGDWRWKGQIYKKSDGNLVAKPDSPVWGPLLWNKGESRAAIREYPNFKELLVATKFEPWDGRPEELNPPLGPVLKGNFARVKWYIPFAGQKGQGFARIADGSEACILGQDLAVPADEDGIVRLHHGDLVNFADIHQNWGTKKDGPPKLLNVRRA